MDRTGSSWILVCDGNAWILSQIAKAVLKIPATLASSERMWSRSSKILPVKTGRWKVNTTTTIMCVGENAEVCRRDHEQIVETVDNPVPLYLPEAGKQDSAATSDVGQDLF